MIKIDFRVPDNRSEEDLTRIIKVGIENGYQISPREAWQLWDEYSDSYAAGWLFVDNDEEILSAIEANLRSK